jgi:hypothetical protein
MTCTRSRSGRLLGVEVVGARRAPEVGRSVMPLLRHAEADRSWQVTFSTRTHVSASAAPESFRAADDRPGAHKPVLPPRRGGFRGTPADRHFVLSEAGTRVLVVAPRRGATSLRATVGTKVGTNLRRPAVLTIRNRPSAVLTFFARRLPHS